LAIFRKLPGWGQIIPVYAVIVTMVYGWTIIRFFWKVPSWLLFMSVGDLLSALSFTLTANLIESLLILVGLLFLCLLLPLKWFRDAFIVHGSLISGLSLGYLMLIADHYRSKTDVPTEVFAWAPLVVIVIAFVLILFNRLSPLRKLVEDLADRLTIFLYLSVPLSAAALAGVLIEFSLRVF